MELEAKLDEDYLFYLNYIGGVEKKFRSQATHNLCEAWFHKLCSELSSGVEGKRNRNIYLSNLILCMEDGKLKGPFLKPPAPGQLPNAVEVFGPEKTDVKEPEWMSNIAGGGDDEESSAKAAGKTYLATKLLPSGQGALGYMAVSLDDSDLVPREGLDTKLGKKYEQMVPPLSEVERILINRKNPEERERIIMHYDSLLNQVKREIQGTAPAGFNPNINSIVDQLISKLKERGEYEPFENMPEEKRRLELLYKIDVLLRQRKNYAQKRASFLDDIEAQVMSASFWDISQYEEDVYKEDKGAYAVRMWNEACSSGPKKKLMDLLIEKYPPILIEKFKTLLANVKESIAVKIQRRHENIVTQLKKDLRREGQKAKKRADEAKQTCDEILGIHKAVKDAAWKVYESEKKRDEYLYGQRKDKDEMYEQMRKALMDTQLHVEAEAERGKYLTKQINIVNTQTEVYQNVNEETVQKLEDENIATMKNIQRLNRAINQQENRIRAMKEMAKRESSTAAGGAQFLYV